LDECLTRTSLRNLRLYAAGECDAEFLAEQFKVAPPEVPLEVITWFREQDSAGKFAELESELAKASESDTM
jgi:hypothetical protein